MKTHVMDLREGDRLSADIFNRVGLHVLPADTSIHKEEIALLIRHSIDYADIYEREEQETFTGMSREQFKQRLKSDYNRTVKGFQAIFLEALTTGKINQAMVDERLKPMIEMVDRSKDVVSLMIMFGEEDVNIYNHSLQVGILSYYLASWLGYSPEECFEIGKAGCLHDIGKSKVGQELRNHTEGLNSAQKDELQRHTRYGYEIIRDSLKDTAPALVALQHHEREDGSGYPQGLKADDIHPYSKIVAVANRYVDLTANDGENGRMGLLAVLKKVYDLGFGELSERAVQALTRQLLPHFIGKQAKLSNGETAQIVWNNPSDYFRPLVQVNERFVDLSVERNIVVEEIMM